MAPEHQEDDEEADGSWCSSFIEDNSICSLSSRESAKKWRSRGGSGPLLETW